MNTHINIDKTECSNCTIRAAATAFTAIVMFVCAALFLACADNTSHDPDYKDEYDMHCTILIECSTILNNLDKFDPAKEELVPNDGIILEKCVVGFNEGETVYDLLRRETRARGIHLEANFTPIYDSAYVEGINNLYEFDCGDLSGWTFCVNGAFPNYGCSSYKLSDGDAVEWHYTCDLGADVDCVWTEENGI